MKIGIDVRELQAHTFTGIGTFLSNFIKYIAYYRTAGYNFVLIGNEQTEPPDIRSGNIIFRRLPSRHSIIWDNVLLPKVLKSEKCDIFYSPYYKMPLFLDIPSVITAHDFPLGFWLKTQQYTQILSSFPRALYAVHKAKMIITVSQHSKNDIKKYFNIDERKIRVVYECADNIFHKSREHTATDRKKYSIPGDAFILLYVGNLKAHKNVSTIFDAFKKLKKEYQNLYLVIVTSANASKKIKIIEKKADNRIIIIQNLKKDELARVYNMSDLFVFISKYEGFGLPPLEAMSCALPVILSDVTSLPEVGGDAAVYVNPNDLAALINYIKRFMTDAAFYGSYSERAYRHAASFSLKGMGDNIISTINDAVD